MKEIGGYLNLELNYGLEKYPELIKLNSGRNCLKYLVRARRIKKIILPEYICDSVIETCVKENLKIQYYEINDRMLPQIDNIHSDEYIYIVNYFSQLDLDQIKDYKYKYRNIILDNAQSFYQQPLPGIDTLYTCRKYFGVPDGAYLSTDSFLKDELAESFSANRSIHLLGRFEAGANKYFLDFQKAEKDLGQEDIAKMSGLTQNMLKSIDYEAIKFKREKNYNFLKNKFADLNQLKVKIVEGPFSYPLLISKGNELKDKLIAEKIYVPTLWPNVLEASDKNSFSYYLANNLISIPVDQRYDLEDMEYIYKTIIKLI